MKKAICVLTLSILFFAAAVSAQTGTYEKKGSNKSYSYISIQKNGSQINAQIFAWWNTPSGRMGAYDGEGTLKGNTCVLHSDLNDPECKITLTLANSKIKATFSKCSVDNLPEDFNGMYTKITDAVAGDYVVAVPKAYFHKKADAATKQKAYVLKGDKVTLDIENITPGKWALVYFTTAKGNDVRGFIPLSQLTKVQ
jgi:hypothetical protein